jgi:Zn-dependent peptidase ImmA (M78 family)
MADWKHRQAEREVEPLLRAAALVDASVIQVFPRPLVDILSAALPALDVYEVEDLTIEVIKRTLRDQFGAEVLRCQPATSSSSVAGFTFANARRVVVFVETKHGPDVGRFTLAHEAGHIVKEVLPRLASSNAPMLFPDEPFLSHDDSLEIIASGAGVPVDLADDDEVRALRARRSSWMREVVANILAAELLAPWREVEKIARAAEHSDEAVSVVRDCFGLSQRAARIRLEELQLLHHDAPRLF